MKSFFEWHEASLICFVFVQTEKGGKMPKRGQNKSRKAAVQDGVQVTENLPSILEVIVNLKETRKQMRSLLPRRFMLELQKLLIKYSNKRMRQWEFPFFITWSTLHGNCDLRLDASSVSCSTI